LLVARLIADAARLLAARLIARFRKFRLIAAAARLLVARLIVAAARFRKFRFRWQ
jgi:hypothetical protein